MERDAVLVIDDDPSTLELARDILTPHGFFVVGAASGDEAIELAGRRGLRVVLVDPRTPAFDGAAFARALGETGRHVSIVVLSRGIEAEPGLIVADGYLAKPFDVGGLLGIARRFGAAPD